MKTPIIGLSSLNIDCWNGDDNIWKGYLTVSGNNPREVTFFIPFSFCPITGQNVEDLARDFQEKVNDSKKIHSWPQFPKEYDSKGVKFSGEEYAKKQISYFQKVLKLKNKFFSSDHSVFEKSSFLIDLIHATQGFKAYGLTKEQYKPWRELHIWAKKEKVTNDQSLGPFEPWMEMK